MQEPESLEELWLPQFKFDDSIFTEALNGLMT